MEQIKHGLVKAAHVYRQADKALERVCGEDLDPIACTIFVRNGQHLETLPQEGLDAAFWLNKVVSLSEILSFQYSMDCDEVRAIWFPILNSN